MRKETVRRGTDQDPHNVTGLSNGLKFKQLLTLNFALCIEDNVDRSLGGASLADGSIELMVHRRTIADDALAIERKVKWYRRPKESYGLDRRGG